MAIVTVAEVQTMLGLGEDDLGGRLEGLTEAASAMAEEYLNRWITEKEYTQVCSGGGSALVLKAYPVKSGTVISFEGVIVTGAILDNEKGLLYREGGRAWPPMPGGYRVTYTGGISQVPAPIKQAIALLVAALNNTVENKGQQVASERLSDYQVSYARPADAAGLEALSVAAAALLRPYRSKQLLDLYGVATPDQLLNGTFLLPGEVSQLFNSIQELSGFGADAVAEVKN